MNAVANVPTLTVRREIAAPAQELFDAWLDPESIAVWMRPGGSTRSKATVDARVGGTYEIIMYTDSGPIPHRGIYQEIDRPRRLVFTWNSQYAGEHGSLVTVEFRPMRGATEIILTHERLPSEEMVKAHTKGWTDILELLDRSHKKAGATA